MKTATGFFCEACLSDKPLDDISPDLRYCQGCYNFLSNEARRLDRKAIPFWVPRAKGAVEPLHRRKYPPETVMIAELTKHHGWRKDEIQKNIQKNSIKRKWKKMVAEKLPKPPLPTPEAQETILKHDIKEIIPPTIEKLIMKHRGRPRKKDRDIQSRVTRWRRRKEGKLQGILL